MQTISIDLEKYSLPIPPGLSDFAWRPARREDAQAIHQLLLDTEKIDQRGWIESLEDRQRDFDDPETNPESDSWLAFTPQGQVAALGWIFSPPQGGQDYIAYLWGEVHPDYRRRGLGDYVLSWMEVRGRQILASRPQDLPHRLVCSFPENLHDRVELFTQHDFQHARSYYRMQCDLHQPIPSGELPAGISLQHWTPELDEATLRAFNEAFRDHWGSIPMERESWELWLTGHPSFRPDLSYLAISNRDEQVIGFLISKVRAEQNQAEGIQEGWIQELGVLRPWRRQGVASALMCEAMHAYRQNGLDYAGLGVDAQNLTGALRIYERLGFKPIKRIVSFAKIIFAP